MRKTLLIETGDTYRDWLQSFSANALVKSSVLKPVRSELLVANLV